MSVQEKATEVVDAKLVSIHGSNEHNDRTFLMTFSTGEYFHITTIEDEDDRTNYVEDDEHEDPDDFYQNRAMCDAVHRYLDTAPRQPEEQQHFDNIAKGTQILRELRVIERMRAAGLSNDQIATVLSEGTQPTER